MPYLKSLFACLPQGDRCGAFHRVGKGGSVSLTLRPEQSSPAIVDETVIHASAACIPAIFAVSERNRLSGEDLLAAMILGIDVCIRVGLGLGDYHYQ